jgi:hypothetical protein
LDALPPESMSAVQRALAGAVTVDASTLAGKLFEESAALAASRQAILDALPPESMSAVQRALAVAVTVDTRSIIGSLASVDAASLVGAWRRELGDDQWSSITDAGAAVAEEVGIELGHPIKQAGSTIRADEVIGALIVLMLFTLTVDRALGDAAVAVAKSALETGRFTVEGLEAVDDRLPHLQNLQVWMLVLTYVISTLRRTKHRQSDDSGGDINVPDAQGGRDE